MRKFISFGKPYLYLITGTILFVLFFTFNSLSSQGASTCTQGVTPNRCSVDYPNWIQSCGNCDTDPDNEWCNITDCTTAGKICINGACLPPPTCDDKDNDGYGVSPKNGKANGCAQDGIDCDDTNKYKFPGNPETCDNYDNDCDTKKDEGCDDDTDGYCDKAMTFYNYPVSVCLKSNLTNGSFGNDCDDNNIAINPGATETCGNSIDEDCTGADVACAVTCTDKDNDGYGTVGSAGCSKSGTDCNDNNATINPGATEVCGNSIDENCDGTNAACASTISISIFQPTQFNFIKGDNVNFSASAMGGSWPYNYTWSSSIDGNIYSGFNNFYSISSLSTGNHLITLTVLDNAGATASKTLNLTVNSVGTLSSNIFSPLNGNEFPAGTLINFSTWPTGGSGTYPTIVWSSDRDGSIGNGTNVSKVLTTIGDHKITLTVADSAGKTFTNSTNIKVISGIAVQATMGMMGRSTFEQGENIFFNAMTTGGTGPYTYSWSSDKDGVISALQMFQKNNLSLGVHQITVTATDSLGAKATKTSALEIITAKCIDSDNDNYGKVASIACLNQFMSDCDDANVNINPGATEICPNSIDENCNGSITDCPIAINILLPASDGQTYPWGSNLNFQVNATGAVVSRLGIWNSSGYNSSVSMNNDGKNGDGAANDNIWGINFPLYLSPGNYNYIISVDNIDSSTRNFNVDNNKPVCNTIVNSGSSADKLDITFISDSTNTSTFISRVQSAYTGLFNLEPFKSNTAKINIHRIDFSFQLGCAYPPSSLACSANSVKEIAAICPTDTPVVLSGGTNYRSYSNGQSAMVWAAYPTFPAYVLPHEFGHLFGGLADEYVDLGITDRGSIYTTNSVNCDTGSSCAKWSAISGTACFPGCLYRNAYYRSIDKGLMNDGTVNDYGVVNINYMKNIFNTYYK